MNRPTDLDAALTFVIKRIEEEATQSGEPLSEEQSFLLKDLPTTPSLLQSGVGGPEDPNVVIAPRDIAYERLCALAKAARNADLQLNAESGLTWDFAAAVTKLNQHPMSWLLQWAGVKPRKPWWDRLLLLFAALLPVLFIFLFVVLSRGEPSFFQWIVAGSVCVVSLALLYMASRRSEDRQLKKEIERCRPAIVYMRAR